MDPEYAPTVYILQNEYENMIQACFTLFAESEHTNEYATKEIISKMGYLPMPKM